MGCAERPAGRRSGGPLTPSQCRRGNNPRPIAATGLRPRSIRRRGSRASHREEAAPQPRQGREQPTDFFACPRGGATWNKAVTLLTACSTRP